MTARPPTRPGWPFPLGVTLERDGANVAVFSAHADRIELCLLDEAGRRETARLLLPERTDHVFHGFVEGLRPGQVYGLRAHGPWAPERGHRFNPARLLLDPYAKAIVGQFRWEGPNLVDPQTPLAPDPRDSAPFVPKGVTRPTAAAEPDDPGRPGTPWDRTILYEAHVKGLTKLHPAVPEGLRGTYLGLAQPPVLDHLVKLGVTAVELMPVAAFLDELRLVRLGLRNYWGYNPYAFMAAEPRYAVRDPGAEFRAMVAALHGAGIEVVLDVVFNHTAETDHLGPTLSFRGLDNASYYRLDPGCYLDWAGTGNTLDLAHPRVLQLVMDALRRWAALGVDGFRFDLATTLGRTGDGGFAPEAPFFQAIAQDPVLGGLKLIAEPWDLGPHGYRQGGFPPPFAMWNDRFRDCVRRFWRGDEAIVPELAGRLLGSADLYEAAGRRPQGGISYVTSHDGFTLKDLVTYARRHNEANGEANRDGHHASFSANWGVEGPTGNPAVRARRDRQRRNLLATLLLSQGVPMLLMGDELGRTQRGNNNAYCQDNELSWLRWERVEPEDLALGEFLRRLIRLRQAYPLLWQTRFLHGRHRNAAGRKDVTWLAPDGREMTEAQWQDPLNRCVGLELVDEEATLLLLANVHGRSVPFVLPAVGAGTTGWRVLLDTAEATGVAVQPRAEEAPAARRVLAAGSLVLLDASPAASADGSSRAGHPNAHRPEMPPLDSSRPGHLRPTGAGSAGAA
jgi:glycogen operon protein